MNSQDICHLSAVDLAAAENTPGTHATIAEESDVLRRAVMQMPDEYRDVIRLRNWEQLSFAEIGRRMERSEEAARKRWSRAIVRLKREVESLS